MRPLHRLVLLTAFFAGGAAHAAVEADCGRAPAGPLTLRLAEERLEACNRELVAARSALRAAESDVGIARQRPNPTMTLGASNLNPQAGLGSGGIREKTFDSSLRIEQLVERGDKAHWREAQGEAARRASVADLREQLRLQRLAARNAFFDLVAAQQRARLQAESAALTAQSERAAARRLAAGDIGTAEANRFRLDAARAANEVRQAELERQRARVELARLLGAEAFAAGIEVDLEWARDEEEPPLAGERPDVVAARERVRAAEAAAALARAMSTRDVTLGVQADRWPASAANPQGTGTSYAITVSMPLFVRHANEGEASRALADLDSARAALARVDAQAAAERHSAAEELRAARERLARVESDVHPLAREVARAAEFAYEKGATGVLDLLDARRSLKAVELDQVQARAEAAKAWARREAALETFTDTSP